MSALFRRHKSNEIISQIVIVLILDCLVFVLGKNLSYYIDIPNNAKIVGLFYYSIIYLCNGYIKIKR